MTDDNHGTELCSHYRCISEAERGCKGCGFGSCERHMADRELCKECMAKVEDEGRELETEYAIAAWEQEFGR